MRTHAWHYETTVKPIHDPDTLALALSFLRGGHVIAIPTDTVYGVASDALNPDAVERLFAVKERPAERAIPLLLADIDDVWHVIRSFPPGANRLARALWPGPLTLVLPAREGLPSALLGGKDTVGVRIPDHPWLRELIRQLGHPLAATSANISGQPPGRTAAEVLAQLKGRIPLIVDGGPAPGGVPSTVVDCTGPEPTILRAGPLDPETIHRLWRGDKSG